MCGCLLKQYEHFIVANTNTSHLLVLATGIYHQESLHLAAIAVC